MKPWFSFFVQSIALEGALYFAYFFGMATFFCVFFFFMLGYFVSAEVFSRGIQSDFPTQMSDATFFGSFVGVAILFCLTQWQVLRKTSQLYLRILRFSVFSVLLLCAYIVGFALMTELFERASFDPKYGRVLPYEKRCPENRTLMMQADEEGRQAVVSVNTSGYVVDASCQAVYYYGNRMKEVDLPTFLAIDAVFAKDRYRAYMLGKSISGADTKTFSIMESTADSNMRVLSGYNVYQAYDEHFLYGTRLNDESAKNPFSMEKREAFLRGVFFPGVEEMGRCHVLRRYKGQIIFRDASKTGAFIEDDRFTQFTPLSDEFNHDGVRIQESDDCSQVEVSDGNTSRRYVVN